MAIIVSGAGTARAQAPADAPTQVVAVDPSAQYQSWQGWGTSLSWWATVVGGWSDENRSQIMDLLFDAEKGLGLNLVRYSIGGQDDPEHNHMRIGGDVQGYRPSEDAPYDWSADAGQRRVLLEAIDRGVTITEAFACSPPYWMTVSGCSAGAENAADDNLRDDSYEAFADYLTEVVRHFRDAWGVEFATLAPMNEPLAHYWKAEGFQQGCHFGAASQERLLALVAAKLREKGLETQLSAADETSTEHAARSLRSYSDAVRGEIAQINAHTYNYSYDRRGLRHLADRYGKRLFMSEICFASRAPGREHDHSSITGALDIARAITRDLREMRPEAWVLWQPLTHEQYSEWWQFNYGLIHADYATEDGTWDVMKKYHGYAQYTRFIRPGYRMVGIAADDAVCFVEAESGALVIVAYNESEAERKREYDVRAFEERGDAAEAYRTSPTEDMAALPAIAVAEGRITALEPGQSVTTYVVRGVEYHGPARALPLRINDDEIGDGEDQFEFVGDWDYTDNAPGPFVSDNHWSGTPGDLYHVRFRGTGIRLYRAVGPNHGIAGVSIDGGEEQSVDLYAAKRGDQSLVFESPLLPMGPHVVTVRVTGDRNPESTHDYIAADRADVLRE